MVDNLKFDEGRVPFAQKPAYLPHNILWEYLQDDPPFLRVRYNLSVPRAREG